ncbi:hypothetical protein L596_023122 [Steinernema carpocapsae]|uniref:Ubiquitin-like protease family profile domain-containing protein n=1 Tax=Steinernema carpocapsae TaxID=34508 RepID=A0A4U5MCR8_STECR|nr:hypothetical protein L596_023122 [Steinernema carpocapsae]
MNSFDLYKLMVDDAFHHLQIHAEDVDLLTEDEGIYDAVLFRMLCKSVPNSAIVHPVSFSPYYEDLYESDVHYVFQPLDKPIDWVVFVMESVPGHWSLAMLELSTGIVNHYDTCYHKYAPEKRFLTLSQEWKLLKACKTIAASLLGHRKLSWNSPDLWYPGLETYVKQGEDGNCGVFCCILAERIVGGGTLADITLEDALEWRHNAAKLLECEISAQK